jgi:hypothetical protein
MCFIEESNRSLNEVQKKRDEKEERELNDGSGIIEGETHSCVM